MTKIIFPLLPGHLPEAGPVAFLHKSIVMLLHINDAVTIGDLQDKFARCFPNLRVIFCRKKHNWEEICPEHMVLHDDSLHLRDIRRNHQQGLLELKSWFKVGEAEKAFENFGLHAQICFRSGKRWIQTGKMDNLTIHELQLQSHYERPSVLL
jgi:hypothetical protein